MAKKVEKLKITRMRLTISDKSEPCIGTPEHFRKSTYITAANNRYMPIIGHLRYQKKTKKKTSGLNPQLSWLTTVCLSNFDRNVPQLIAVPCPSTPVPSTHKSRYPLAINIFKFPDDVHLFSLMSCFDACLECQVTVNSIKAEFLKKHVCKKY